jgi:beta-galactosidase
MRIISMNTGWRYAHLGRGDWREITLPHDAMLSEERTEDSAGGTNTGFFAACDYEYEKNFTAPEDAAYLAFEGVYHRAEVTLDGQPVPAHPNGYFGFRVPVTPGEHTVRVIAHNAQQPSSRWYSGAGIYRPVTMICLPEKHILPESIAIRTLDYKARKIRVDFRTNTPAVVRVEILSGGKQLLSRESTGAMEIEVPEASLWSPAAPNLCVCRLSCGEDVQEVRFGIRSVEVDAKRGFRINGERVILLGACIHHDNGMLGAAGHPFAERRKIELLKKAGYNAIRSAHNPVSKAILDACDDLGVMVLDEYVDMWYIHKTQFDYASLFEQRWKDDLRLLVEKDVNHPSVVMYSIGNEVSETAQPKGIELTEQMVRRLHELDPDRPVTCGINIFFNYLSSLGFGVYSDKKAEQEAANAEKAKGKKKKKAVGSEFINNVAGMLGAGFMKFGATLHGSDVKTRDAFAKLDVAGYNYGVNRYRHDLKKYPDRVILGSETFAGDAVTFYDLAKENPALIGDFVWTGMDYLGEVGLGAWEYSAYAPTFEHGHGWITAGAGTIDLADTETGQMAYTQMAFELSPVRIAVEPVCFSGEKHSPAAWRVSNALETWSWEGCEGRMAAVEVYARGQEAELLLNGRNVGRKVIPRNGVTKFRVPYEPGELTAIIRDAAGKETARTSLRSAGRETKLSLVPEVDSIHPDQLLYVRLRYTDGQGMVKPGLRGEIRVSVAGGQLLALGNACSYNERGYFTDTTDTYYGEALAIIRPEGDVTLNAQSPFGETSLTVPNVGK